MGQGLQCLGGWSSWAAGAGGAGSCRLVAGVGWGRGMGGCRDRLRRGVVGRQCPEVVAVSQRSGLSLWPRRCARGLHGRGCAWCPVTTYLLWRFPVFWFRWLSCRCAAACAPGVEPSSRLWLRSVCAVRWAPPPGVESPSCNTSLTKARGRGAAGLGPGFGLRGPAPLRAVCCCGQVWW